MLYLPRINGFHFARLRTARRDKERAAMTPITITNVKTILTAPAGIRLVVVKIETSEPGLYGLGCATFTQRHQAVAAALEHHLKPFLIGKEVHRIEDIFQTSMVNAYWRNGPRSEEH